MAQGTEMTILFEGGKTKSQAMQKPLHILAWSWGLSSSRRSADDSEVLTRSQNISMTKYIGAESPFIALLMKDKATFKTTVFKCENESSMITMTFKNVYFTSLSTGGSGGEDRLTENITLGFDSMEYQYTAKEGGKVIQMESVNLDFSEST